MASPLGNTDRPLSPLQPGWQRKWLGRLLFFLIGGLLVYVWGIWQQQWPAPVFLQKPIVPYEQYVHRLESARLHESGLGKAWVEAGKQVLWDSLTLDLPLKEAGFFPSERALARSYVFEATEGELVKASLAIKAIDTPQVFIDLFYIGPERFMERVAFADSGSWELNFRIPKAGGYLLRIQPELFRSLSYTLLLERAPSLAFPVDGKDSRAIRSFFGAPRDGGRRKHKGVDIFATKGTPVLAAAPGRVIRVKEGGLGGKVVWVRSSLDGAHHYYAHLDEQWVRRGQEVREGDTLGLVGNTGNARTTPSHLHFGIYFRRRGAVDPFPFIRNEKKQAAPITCSLESLGSWQRIAQPTGFLDKPRGQALTSLLRYQPVQVLAAQGAYFRVQLADGSQGFVHSRKLEPLNKLELLAEGEVRENPHPDSPLIIPSGPGVQLSLLARDAELGLVELPDGMRGWISISPYSSGTEGGETVRR